MPGLKPRPTAKAGFSAACEARLLLLDSCGPAKAVPLLQSGPKLSYSDVCSAFEGEEDGGGDGGEGAEGLGEGEVFVEEGDGEDDGEEGV